MCGISGLAAFKNTGLPLGVLQTMTDALRHRGPDDQGCFRAPTGHAALGHRRLSIIDLSSGHQPVFNEDGQVAIVFNGEIYNFLELRDALEKKGHRFTTRSDTEVIVHLYEEEGPECVRRLRGMFALAIWDGRREQLFLCRDRVGKKPIYYACANDTLYFASEIQALYNVPGIAKEIDYTALDLYLTYCYIPSPHTIYKGIRKLPPAHYLTMDATGVRVSRYWTPDYKRKTVMTYEEAQRELVRILTDAVRLRLISDVPLGAFLSGGVDSATVVALMSRLSDAPVKTFSIGFPDREYNELEYAREVAQRYHTEHHEFVVEPEGLDVLAEIVRHYGEPYGDSSAVPTWYLSRLTRQHVTVALNGDGGDELFGGYYVYQANHQLSRAARVVSPILARQLGRLFGPLTPRRIRNVLSSLQLSERNRFQLLRSYITPTDRTALYQRHFVERLEQPDQYVADLYDEKLPTDYDRALFADFVSYLPEDLLVKVDRASMAHSLECRSPFLDHELVEFAASLPAQWKIDAGRSKRILKDVVAPWFPEGFVERRKMGFTIPVGKWFRGELKSFIRDRLINGPLTRLPLLESRPLENLLSEHFNGTRNHEPQIWNLLMLSLWFEEYGADA